jgi:hypothetical protein
VTSSVPQLPGQLVVNSAPGVLGSQTLLRLFQAPARLCNGTMVSAMCPIRTLVLVDTLPSFPHRLLPRRADIYISRRATLEQNPSNSAHWTIVKVSFS